MPKKSAPPNRIAEIRKAQSLSQQDLGALIGAHFVTISKLENGKLPLTDEWRAKIADALRVDRSEIGDAQKRRIYVTGTVEGNARVDIWNLKQGRDEKLFIETDLYAGDAFRVQWLLINGDALYPVFQHLDLLQIAYERDGMDKLRGNLCAIETIGADDRPLVLVGIPTTQHDDKTYDIYMLNGPVRKRQHIVNIARVSAALFRPAISDKQFRNFQKMYVPFRDEVDWPTYTPLASWLKTS